MITPTPGTPAAPESEAPPESPLPPTPWKWRAAIAAAVLGVAFAAYLAAWRPMSAETKANAYRLQAFAGILCFLGTAAFFSVSLQSVRRKTLLWGIGLQVGLALAVLHVKEVKSAFDVVGTGIKALIAASDEGAKFVFGPLANEKGPLGFVFAFKALPPIIFISAFFSVLYYFGVLQVLVRLMARVMQYLMGTSGAETLSVSANVFMGQTEAPLIVKPYVPRMTKSELLALMGSGMAHISGGMMALYISYGADATAILCTCVMACPCALYLTKLVYPEAGKPATLGDTPANVETPYVNAIDAAAGGVKDGLWLALNVAAMLIAFLAFIALFDAIIGGVKPLLFKAAKQRWIELTLLGCAMAVAFRGLWMWRTPGKVKKGAVLAGFGFSLFLTIFFLVREAADAKANSLAWWPDDLTLKQIFGWLFAPVAFLLGIDPSETQKVGSLLGIKLAANEHVAFLELKAWKEQGYAFLSKRSQDIAVFALTGFANFASVGIQLGGIGAIAPGRRADLAKLGMRALFVGFLATLINAAVAGLLM